MWTPFLSKDFDACDAWWIWHLGLSNMTMEVNLNISTVPWLALAQNVMSLAAKKIWRSTWKQWMNKTHPCFVNIAPEKFKCECDLSRNLSVNVICLCPSLKIIKAACISNVLSETVNYFNGLMNLQKGLPLNYWSQNNKTNNLCFTYINKRKVEKWHQEKS